MLEDFEEFCRLNNILKPNMPGESEPHPLSLVGRNVGLNFKSRVSPVAAPPPYRSGKRSSKGKNDRRGKTSHK